MDLQNKGGRLVSDSRGAGLIVPQPRIQDQRRDYDLELVYLLYLLCKRMVWVPVPLLDILNHACFFALDSSFHLQPPTSSPCEL